MRPVFLAPPSVCAPEIDGSGVTSHKDISGHKNGRVRPGDVMRVCFRPQRCMVCVHSFRIDNAQRWEVINILVGDQDAPRAVLYKGGMTPPRYYVHVAQDCWVVARYIGTDPNGEVFRAVALGYEMRD